MERERRDHRSRRWIPVLNKSGETIPGFACMEVGYSEFKALHVADIGPADTSTVGKRIRWPVYKPGQQYRSIVAGEWVADQNPTLFLFNGPVPILKNKGGVGTMDFPCQALYTGTLVQDNENAAGSSPVAFRQTAGPVGNSWQLELGASGYHVLGFDWSCLSKQGVSAPAGIPATVASAGAASNARIWIAPNFIRPRFLAAFAGDSPVAITDDTVSADFHIGTWEISSNAIVIPATGIYLIKAGGNIEAEYSAQSALCVTTLKLKKNGATYQSLFGVTQPQLTFTGDGVDVYVNTNDGNGWVEFYDYFEGGDLLTLELSLATGTITSAVCSGVIGLEAL